MSDQPAPAYDPPQPDYPPPSPPEQDEVPPLAPEPEPDAPLATSPVDEKRQTLIQMGAAKVRHLLSQQLLVHHLIQPAHAWLAELDQEKTDAIDEGQQQSGDVSKHQDGDGGGQAPEASGSDSLSGSGQGSDDGDATERGHTADEPQAG